MPACDYEISQKKETKGLPADGAIIKTIVTTNLGMLLQNIMEQISSSVSQVSRTLAVRSSDLSRQAREHTSSDLRRATDA